MNKKNNLFLMLLTAAVIIIISSCKKKSEDELTKTELLTNKNWKLTARTSEPVIDLFQTGIPVNDVYAVTPDCMKDDFMRFSPYYYPISYGTVSFDEGLTKCNQGLPQTIPGIWSFENEQTVIKVDTISWTLITLNENTLKVSYPFTFLGNSFTFVSTYSNP